MPKRTQNAPEEFSQYERALAKEIGARIRLRRKELGLTQEQLRTHMAAERVLVSRSHFSRMSSGSTCQVLHKFLRL
jgi:predicted transcriptional regulator